MIRQFKKGLSVPEMQVTKLFRHTRSNSYGSRKRYKSSCLAFAKYLSLAFKLQNIANISNKHVVAFIKHRQESGVSAKTIKNDLSAIRYLHDLISQPRNYLAPNAVLKVDYGLDLEKTPAVKGNRAWTDEEFAMALVLATEQNRDIEKDVMLLCDSEGFRVAEATGSRRSQAVEALKNGWYQVMGEAKNGKWRRVPLTETAREVFERRIKMTKPGGRLFCEDGEKLHKVIHRLEVWLENYRAQIETKEGRKLRTWEYNGETCINEITYHGLRFRYVQRRINEEMTKGFSEVQACYIVSQEIGHNREDVIEIYRACTKDEK